MSKGTSHRNSEKIRGVYSSNVLKKSPSPLIENLPHHLAIVLPLSLLFFPFPPSLLDVIITRKKVTFGMESDAFITWEGFQTENVGGGMFSKHLKNIHP